MIGLKYPIVTILVASVFLLSANRASAGTLRVVKERGVLKCGVNGDRAGFSSLDGKGKWIGLDVDTCRAIAAAVLGDANAVEYVKTTSQTRFTALQTGEIDVLSRNTSMTYSRDASLGVDFAAITFYDGQGFMVPAALGVSSVDELDGASICVLPGTTAEKVVETVFASRDMRYAPVVFQDARELSEAFFAGRCDAHIQSTSGLSAIRSTLASNPADYVILPGVFDKDPMGPVVRQDDARWKDIVHWVVGAMLTGEELGITSKNVVAFQKGDDERGALLGNGEKDIGEALGLSRDWVANVIRQVGNYAEVFDANLGAGSPLKLERGQNALWKDGGLMYAAPLK